MRRTLNDLLGSSEERLRNFANAWLAICDNGDEHIGNDHWRRSVDYYEPKVDVRRQEDRTLAAEEFVIKRYLTMAGGGPTLLAYTSCVVCDGLV